MKAFLKRWMIEFDNEMANRGTKINRSRSGSSAGAGRNIVAIIVTIVVAGIAAGVGVAIIGDGTTGILATGATGDLNLTGLVRTVIQLSPLVIALAVAIAMFRALEITTR